MGACASQIEAGVWHLQSEAWQTSSVLVLREDDSLVCGPGFTDALILSARKYEGQPHRATATKLLVTHVDFDHLRGVFCLPRATVVAGSTTARLLEQQTTREKLRRLAAEWGQSWPSDPHVDEVVEASALFSLGPFRVKAVDARGHTPDGLAYLLPEQGLLLPGDYLSSSTYPFLTASLRQAISTYERLIDELVRDPIRWVIPGHGPCLNHEDAKRIAQEDLDYLRELDDVARAALAGGMRTGPALVRTYAVEPPRANLPEFEVFAPRISNARLALDEARESLGDNRPDRDAVSG